MQIRFVPLTETTPRPGETILDAARTAGVPLGNSCGAVGVCARCRVTVLEGAESLSAPTAIETRVASSRAFAADERLACQAVITGNCAVTTSYWR